MFQRFDARRFLAGGSEGEGHNFSGFSDFSAPPPAERHSVGRAPEEQAQQVAAQAQAEGCCIFWSDVLGELVAFVADGVAPPALPVDVVVYRESELLALFGPGCPDPSPARLRLIHAAKKQGAIIAAAKPAKTANVWDDPRPDLAEDSPLWAGLLALAFERHGHGADSVAWLLQGLRCCGARLETHDGRLRLEPGELGAEYAEVREKWLLPHREAVTTLLEALGHPQPEPVP